jgi:hypothetical protein
MTDVALRTNLKIAIKSNTIAFFIFVKTLRSVSFLDHFDFSNYPTLKTTQIRNPCFMNIA